MSKSEARPDSSAMIIEDVVTATLLTNLGAMLQYGATLKETMFLRKRNWQFVTEALDLQGAGRFDTLILLQVLEEKGEMKNPREQYQKLIQSLNGDHDFVRVYPFWLGDARKRFVDREEKQKPLLGPDSFNDVASHRSLLWYQAAQLGGMDIGVHFSKAGKEFRRDLYERRATGGANLLTTGFPRVDEAVILDPGQTIILAARPGIGKTSLAIEFLLRSERIGPSLINTLEMDFNQLVRKFLESSSVMPGYMIKKPWMMEDSHLQRLEEGLSKLEQTNIYFCRLFDLLQLEAAIIQSRPVLVVVDYVQLYTAPASWRGSRSEYITMVSNNLARMSRTHKTIFLVLSQLNRKGKDDPDSHNLKDAGGLEESADSVWILDRPFMEEESRINLKTILKVTKNRSGGSYFEQELLFDEETQRFLVWDEQEAEKLWQRKVANLRRTGQGPGGGDSSHAIP